MSEILRTNEILSKGYGVSPKLVMVDENLTIEAKAIYAYLSSFCGSGNTAFPTIELITSHLKISTERFYKHFNLLIKQGYITKEQSRKKNGTFTNNTYILNTVVTVIEEVEEVEETEIIDEDKNEIEPNEEITEEVKSVTEKTIYGKSVSGKSIYGKPKTNNNSINNNSINNIYKKDKKEKNKISSDTKTDFDNLIEEYTDNQELKNTIYEFIKMRKMIKKPLTTRALEMNINELDKLANSDELKIQILEQSINKCYLGVFPLKNNFNNTNNNNNSNHKDDNYDYYMDEVVPTYRE